MVNKTVLILSAAVLVTAIIAILSERGSRYRVVSVQEAHRRIGEDPAIVLLDVRTVAEYDGELGHLANALHIPVEELEERVDELSSYRDRDIIAYCRTGNRSGRAAEFLSRKGFSALNMAGGIIEWKKQHLPVVVENSR
jgi:rhodanese-related sulfurtransferase